MDDSLFVGLEGCGMLENVAWKTRVNSDKASTSCFGTKHASLHGARVVAQAGSDGQEQLGDLLGA